MRDGYSQISKKKGRRKSKEKNKKALIDQSRYMVWSFVHHHSD
jgi:hypothetical protein